MRYEYECDHCGYMEDIYAPMNIGPPKDPPICKECNIEMFHNFGTNFILVGDGFAGKDLKKREYKMAESREKNDAQLSEDSRNQRIVDEVTEIRRKGHKAVDNLKKEEPQKFKDYQHAIKNGYRSKTKSFKFKD